jgi:outer membrane protein OmpA-like peptidoglycan-associated protein
MNRQSQRLFETPVTLESDRYSNLHNHPEYYQNLELERQGEVPFVTPLSEEGGSIPEWETLERSEYPQASRFVLAKYYGKSQKPRTIRRIVIHITDGGSNINGTVSWFQYMLGKDGKPAVDRKEKLIKASAHYIVGQDGEVVQMVRENDVAYHAGSANSDSIGIEHVARKPKTFNQTDKGLSPSQTQYCSSAALVRWLCQKYRIPINRVYILGHAEADPETSHKACPNSVWNWDYFMKLVTGAFRCSAVSPMPPAPPTPQPEPLPTAVCSQVSRPEVLDRFEHNKDGVRSFHQSQVRKIAQCVVASQRSSAPIRSLRLVGHSDSSGMDAYNLTLGRRRAERVQDSLKQQIEALQRGLSGKLSFAVESLGERKPTRKGAAYDRRVEVFLLRQTAPMPPPFCNPFLPTNPSENWTDYIAAPTTGRMTPLINGRDAGGGTRSAIDRVEAFATMERILDTLAPNDTIYLVAWQFDPRVPLINPKPGVADWGLLFRQKAQQGVKIRIIMTDFDPLSGGYKDYGGGLHGQVYKEFLPVLNQRISELPNPQRDNLKYIMSRHPVTALTRNVATHHQKFMVIRKGMETIAFCGGLDISWLRTSHYWRNPKNPRIDCAGLRTGIYPAMES